MAKFEVGSRMKFSEGGLSWTGRIIEVIPEIVFLELDEPVPFMYAPQNTAVDAIERGHLLDESWGLGESLYEVMKKEGMTIPPGSWQKKPKEFGKGESWGSRFGGTGYYYAFNEPYPLSVISEMCYKKYRGQRHCWLQASVLRVIPIFEEHTLSVGELMEEARDPYGWVSEYPPPVWENI